MRNVTMAERVAAAAPPRGSVRFAFAGDSGAWPDPTAEAVYAQLLSQAADLAPPPAFFVNLGDFAGPGTPARHEAYVAAAARLPFPNFCVIGNHDLDAPDGRATFERVHGPPNFAFACGHTRFVALHAQPGVDGTIDVRPDPERGNAGPREEDLAFLDAALAAAAEPNRVVLMHMPPHLGGHYAPHADWGFRQREREFLALLREHRVRLVCCAHGLAFDHHVHEGIRFVMSGGGGSGLCSDWKGVCASGDGRPEDRGALFHFVEVELAESGAVRGRVHQAFAPTGTPPRIEFGDAS